LSQDRRARRQDGHPLGHRRTVGEIVAATVVHAGSSRRRARSQPDRALDHGQRGGKMVALIGCRETEVTCGRCRAHTLALATPRRRARALSGLARLAVRVGWGRRVATWGKMPQQAVFVRVLYKESRLSRHHLTTHIATHLPLSSRAEPIARKRAAVLVTALGHAQKARRSRGAASGRRHPT